MDREKIIKQRERELLKIYKDLPKDKYTVAAGLVKRAAFMSVQLEDLERALAEKGVIEEYTNGKNQRGLKQSTELKSYNSLTSRYMVIINRLLELIPKQAEKKNGKLMQLVTSIEKDTTPAANE